MAESVTLLVQAVLLSGAADLEAVAVHPVDLAEAVEVLEVSAAVVDSVQAEAAPAAGGDLNYTRERLFKLFLDGLR